MRTEMVARKATENDNDNDNVPDLPVLRFDKPWKVTVRVDKIRTAHMTGADGNPFDYPLLWITLDAGAGEQNLLHAFPQSLVSELRAVKPAAGDVITIEHQGSKVTKSKRTARIFEVTAGADASAYDWDNAPF